MPFPGRAHDLFQTFKAGLPVQVASYFGWPVSTTHAIVGALLGFGAMAGGIHAVQWNEVGRIAMSWVISPALSGL